jgi:PIN domain nuclease of toxin-antitoxin system
VRLLLDTNALFWSLIEPGRLSKQATGAIEDEANDVLVSVVSAWEIGVKRAKGKLDMPTALGPMLSESRFDVLPVTLPHALAVESLPHSHHDPFDRLLVAQAQIENLVLVTSDRQMHRYPIAVLPAI